MTIQAHKEEENSATPECNIAPDSMRIFVTLVTTCVGLSLLSTALQTALPSLIASLGVSLSAGQWVTSGYALALAVMTPFTAFLSTRFSTRPLYLGALGCFLVGTLISALAPTFAFLMVGRVLQASANALIANITQVSILTLFPDKSRGRAMGWFGLATSAAPIAAPALGGLVVDAWGWRAVFWLIGALCLASFIAATFFMKNILPSAPKQFDPVSFCLSIAAFGGITLGLGNIVSSGITNVFVWAPLVVGALCGVPFVARQLKSENPFLKVQLFSVRNFRTATITSMLLYAAMMGASAVLPLFIQGQLPGQLGYSATVSGLVVLPGACATALISPVAGRIYDRFGVRVLAFVGGGVMALSCAVLCIPGLAHSVAVLTLTNMVRCAAVGCLTMPLMTWGNTSVPQHDMPHASALLTSMRNIAGALGTAIFVGLFEALGIELCFAALAATNFLIVLLFIMRR